MPELKFEQEQAVMHDQGNVIISASAGSGKTFVMIERLIRLISQRKATVGQILAVTFTDAAAREMKEKLKTALIKKIEGANDNQLEKHISGDKELVKQLAELPTADISTIHSFCGKLVRTYFFKVGVQPDFKVLDDGEVNAIKQEAINRVFKEFYDSGEEWFLRLASRHEEDRGDEEFKKLILSLYEFCLNSSDFDKHLKIAEEYYSVKGFNKLLTDFKKKINGKLERYIDLCDDAIYAFSNAEKFKMEEFAKGLKAEFERALVLPSAYDLKQFANFKLDLPTNQRLKSELKDFSDELVGVRDNFKDIINGVRNGFNEYEEDVNALDGIKAHVTDLFKVLHAFDNTFAELKREENGLDFGDMERFALTILKDPEIAKDVRNKYKYVFVDEYQDVNDVQEEILSIVSKENLFMVGDVKQSIYGFRGSRPEIFVNKFAKMEKNKEKTILLNYNFRSASGILDAVNKIFCYCMTEDYYGSSYQKTSMLKGGGIYPNERAGRVTLHMVTPKKSEKRPPETPVLYDLIEASNKPQQDKENPVAQLVAKIINDERDKEFYDPKTKEMRPVTYSDIAVLTRKKENAYVKEVVNGLIEYGIPVRSVVKENVTSAPEIRSIISVLELVDCFAQDIPLASALKSVVGGFTDEDLAEIALRYNDDGGKGGFYKAYEHYLKVADTSLSVRLKEFDDYFKDLRDIADFVGAYGVLKRLIQDKNLEQALFAQPNGNHKVKRLRLFLNASKTSERAFTVREFLDRIKNYPSNFGMADSPEEDAVTVMTIHKSKGLEFPVVIVCGLEQSTTKKEDKATVMCDQDKGFAIKSYDDKTRRTKETPFRAIFRDNFSDNRLKEELRLFYVALTRASYSLHMTFKASKDKRRSVFKGANSFLDYLPKDMDIKAINAEDIDVKVKGIETKKVLFGTPDEVEVEKIKNDLNYQYPYLADTKLPLKNSVTGANILEDDKPLVHVLYEEMDGKTDIERGNIAHKIMELTDFSRTGEFRAQVQKMVENGAITELDLAKINLDRLENAVKSGAFDGLKGMKTYPEKQFIVSVEASKVFDTESQEQVLLQGVIDLLAIDDNQAVIVDYKYSSLTAESLARKYKKQLELYAYAVEKTLGKKVKEKTLVNLYTGDVVKV
ncbi:MAG: UvrD-helicase domain-containing protein [Clostridia bacterium]|nr:UvrD-helicase domain-containing protein [Clostridia bacterium]